MKKYDKNKVAPNKKELYLRLVFQNSKDMTITPVAYFHSPFGSKFGIPRQSGIVEEVEGEIHFVEEYQNAEAIRGLEDFEYLWLIWGFSANAHEANGMTVRPPRLGGNKRMGVFATRSPYRPNPLGLSSVKLKKVEFIKRNCPVLTVLGADLMDGTPIYDIKPYIPCTDAHVDAKAGFLETNEWKTLQVEMPEAMKEFFSEEELQVLTKILEQDPRPQYKEDGDKVYGMTFKGKNVRFTVENSKIKIIC